MSEISFFGRASRLPAAVGACCCLVLFHASCHAALGGLPADLGAEARSTSATLSSGAITYTVRNTLLPGGTQVREYVDGNGTVFAVTWNGPFLPDLKVLLGAHFDAYRAESSRQPKAGHSHLNVDQAGLVIESSGHMRAFDGSAWLPSRLPAGFSPDSLR